MKTLKKFFVGLLAVAMSFSLAACSSGEKTTTTDTPTTDGETTTETAYKTTFTYAVGGEPNYLDPAIGSD